jgi:hypothetical protein
VAHHVVGFNKEDKTHEAHLELLYTNKCHLLQFVVNNLEFNSAIMATMLFDSSESALPKDHNQKYSIGRSPLLDVSYGQINALFIPKQHLSKFST